MIDPLEREKYRQVAYNIYLFRIAKNWTQEVLSNESGVERAKISRIENSREDFLFSTILKLAKALDTTVEKIIEFTVIVPVDFEKKKVRIPKRRENHN